MDQLPRQYPDTPRVAVLGSGQMGLVCAQVLGSERPGGTAAVVMWWHTAEESGRLAQSRRSDRLPGFVLPESVRVGLSDAQALSGVDLIVSAIPVQFMRSAWSRLREHVPAGAGVVSVAKGIEVNTLLSPTNIIVDCLGPLPVACLSGPSIAPEVAAHKPATVVVASKDASVAGMIQACFATKYFRV